MVRLLPILVALFLGHVAAQDTGISACSAGCISQVFSDTTKFACTANDKVCACNSPNFQFAVRDCIIQACGTDDQDEQLLDAQTSANSQCDAAKASAGVSSSSTTSSPTTAATTTAATTTAPVASTTTTATSSPSLTTSTSTDAKSPTPTTSTTQATTSPAATSALSTSTSRSSGVGKAGTSTLSSSTSVVSTTAASGASSTSSSESVAVTSDSSSSELGVAAKAGIGAGVGVALLLSALITCYILVKKRKAKKGSVRHPTMQISRPLPGSGRQYAQDIEAAKAPSLSTYFRNDFPAPIQAAKYSPSTVSSQYSPRSLYAPSRPSREDDYHDVQGRRYEDMLPRTQPKTMI